MTKYPYIKIRGKYYCREYGLRKLARLYFHDRETCSDFIDWRVLLWVLLDKFGLRKRGDRIALPACGAWCLRVRCGYKIFDPVTRTATKVFDDDIDQDLVKEEIEQHRYVGQSTLAPTVKDWNEQERWYSEEFLSGPSSYYFSPASNDEFMRIYYRDVAPCLVELIDFKPPEIMVINQQVEKLCPEIDRELEVIKERNAEIEPAIRAFYESVRARLEEHGDEQLYRVFAHGDFHLFNLFKTAAGMKLIDWEGISEQSLLYDFFNYFFSHLWVGRGEDGLVEEVVQAIDDMVQRLEHSSADLAGSLRDKSELYLMMYYLERIHATSTVFRSTPEAFLVWVNVYRGFEENSRGRLSAPASV